MTSQGKKGKGGGEQGGKKEGSSTLQFNSLNLAVFPDVYFPHEDSFLLAGAAEKHAFGKVLDLGCGTGIAGICASKNAAVTEVVFADTSRFAIKNAQFNSKRNSVKKKVSFSQSNLFSNLINQQFDTICFNPPYLPTSKEEKLEGEINSAFDGGRDGRKIIDRFLLEFEEHLNGGGILLYLHSSLTGDEKTHDFLKQRKLAFEKVSSQRFFFEELCVYKIAWL
ncbi:MAG: HemK2/MTQ2 family protein methyltransferase [Candidatus Micrarchaeota archaeon]